MSLNNDFRRANIGVNIPNGTPLVTFGDYFVARFSDMDPALARGIDSLLSRFTVDQLKRLSGEITSGVGSIYSSYKYLSAEKDSRTKDPLDISNTVSMKNYDAYVSSSAIKSMTLMRGISTLVLDTNKKSVPFQFNDGVISVEIKNDQIPLDEVKDICVRHFEEKGSSIDIVEETVLDRVAQKVFSGNDMALERFNNDPNKVVSNISLKESAELFSNGKVSGKVGSKVVSGPMTGEVNSYLTSSQSLKAMFVQKNGVNTAGAEIPQSSEFIKCGADLYRLGLNSSLNSAIISGSGLDADMKDIDAQAKFKGLVEMYAKYISDAVKNPDIDAPNLPDKVLFNFSWVAEAYKKAKGTPELLKQFQKDYVLMLSSFPKYCGQGNYRYFIELKPNNKPLTPRNFFRIPKIVDKLVGHYNIMSLFRYGLPFSSIIGKFFEKNVSSMSSVILPVFSVYSSSYSFKMSCMGSSNVGEVWEDDSNEEQPEVKVYEEDYQSFGDSILKTKRYKSSALDPNLVSVSNKVKDKSKSVFDADSDSDTNKDEEYVSFQPKKKIIGSPKRKKIEVEEGYEGDDISEKQRKAPASKFKRMAVDFREALAKSFPWLIDLDEITDKEKSAISDIVRYYFYKVSPSSITSAIFKILISDTTEYEDDDDDTDHRTLFSRFVKKKYPAYSDTLLGFYDNLPGSW